MDLKLRSFLTAWRWHSQFYRKEKAIFTLGLQKYCKQVEKKPCYFYPIVKFLPAQVTPLGTVKKVRWTVPGLNLRSLAFHVYCESSDSLKETKGNQCILKNFNFLNNKVSSPINFSFLSGVFPPYVNFHLLYRVKMKIN